MSLTRFTPGILLEQKSKWLEIAEELYRLGGVVEKVALDAFQSGEIDLRSKEFMNMNTKNITFNNRKYSSWEALKNEKIDNYGSVLENLDEVGAELENLKNIGVVREVKKFDSEHVVSPIHWIKNIQPDGSVKVRLVHHDKSNCFYTKPKCPLPQLDKQIYSMSHLDLLCKEDQKKCFYQYRLGESSSKKLAFTFTGKDGVLRKFCWSVLPFGVAGATFVVQSINKVFADYYSLKFGKFIMVYIDDFAFEPSDNKFLQIASDLGYIFNPKKSEKGPIIDLLGWTLNLTAKTAKITKDKKSKIEQAAAKMLQDDQVRLDDLQSFLGRIGFAARLSKLGRLNSFYLDRLLASEQSAEPFIEKKTCPLNHHLSKEISYWQGIGGHDPVDFKPVTRIVWDKKVWTDSSSAKWAVKVEDKTWAGKFSDDQINWPIILKEAVAVKNFLSATDILDKEVSIFVDNMPLVKSFNKKFSKNEQLHIMIRDMHFTCLNKNLRVELIWISTAEMKSVGADDASRGKYNADPNSLSPAGVGKVNKILNLNENDTLYDLFSSPADNVFATKYFSRHSLQDDPDNLGEGAFEMLERLGSEGRRLYGKIWAFPPRNVVHLLVDSLVSVGIEKNATLFLLVEADLVVKSFNLLKFAFKIKIHKFSKPRDRRLFQNRPALPRSVIELSALDL